jgi:hypothetical protein
MAGLLRDWKSNGHSANERGKCKGVKRVRTVILAVRRSERRSNARTVRAFDEEGWECGCYK